MSLQIGDTNVEMIAKRDGSDFDLFADGFKIGRLSDCEVCHIFQTEDEDLDGYVSHRIEGDMSLGEMLKEVRLGYEAYREFCRLEAQAEARSENAYVRMCEDRYDPEAQRDLELHDFLHPNGYGV